MHTTFSFCPSFFEIIDRKCCIPFPFGGAQHFLPEFLIFARKVEYVWAMHFCLTRGGGGGGSSSFGVIEYGTPPRGRVWEGVSPSHDGDFFLNLGTKNQVLGAL